MSEETSFKYIVRIAGTDIDGKLKLPFGLAKIKGIGIITAFAILRFLGINENKLVGYLTEDEIKKLEDAVTDIRKLGLPSWLYNRRRDYESGEDLHYIGADLIFAARRDIEREIKMGSWRGVRHKLGLKVRGQRTRTTGRLGMTVGVRKKQR